MKISRITLVIAMMLLLSEGKARAMDPQDVLEDLLPAENNPRVLNTEDIPELSPSDPQPLFTPMGDFDSDGNQDMAISGIYDLTTRTTRHFLLVATKLKNSPHYAQLFYKEYPMPVFLHRAGTTGEADPGDQAFSISFCSNCDQGYDFYWNPVKKEFDLRLWKSGMKRVQKPVLVPARQVPAIEVDLAIKIISQLNDVQTYIKDGKARQGAIGVRVDFADKSEQTRRYNVVLFEKKKSGEDVYDRLLVNTKNMRVLKRERKPAP